MNEMPDTSTSKSRPEKIEAIRQTPRDVEDAVAGLTEAQLDTPYREVGWTPRQVVHHIADSHMNAFIRMKLILAEDHPTLKPYEQDVWVTMKDSLGDIGPSLSIISGLHSRMAELLSNVKDEEWSRTAYHPENGEMTLDDLLTSYSTHGKHHADQIVGLRTRMGW